MRLAFIISASVLFFCLIQMLLRKAWKQKLAVEDRLKKMQDGADKKSGQKLLGGRKKRGSIIRVSDAIRNSLDLAGINMGPEEFIFVWIMVACFPALLALVLSMNFSITVTLAALMAFAPIFYLRSRIAKQKSLFERQLGDALMVLSNALRAGFSFPQALASVANDLPDPISGEFLSISRDMQLGGDLEESMLRVADRMESADLRLITTAVVIQQQVGGNLSEILDTISQTIRDRLAIKRSIKTLTAQGRISGKVIGAMPVGVAAIIFAMNPSYIMPLFTTALGRLILIVGAVMECLGFAVIKKIVDINF